VCDPFRRAKSALDILDFNKCYDIAPLGNPGGGTSFFSLRLRETGDGTILTLEWERHRKGKGKKRENFKPWRMPIYFDGGANCVHVGRRNGGIVMSTDFMDEEDGGVDWHGHQGDEANESSGYGMGGNGCGSNDGDQPLNTSKRRKRTHGRAMTETGPATHSGRETEAGNGNIVVHLGPQTGRKPTGSVSHNKI
jgi:hypothetical protein